LEKRALNDMTLSNLFAGLPPSFSEELFEPIVETASFKLERIVSAGQATPRGQWYDQEAHEWVILLQGSAGLLFEGQAEVVVLHPGDYVLIPAHCRHRVEWTDAAEKTVWLALHYRAQ
jgi:cupin 2 domain-containing protein